MAKILVEHGEVSKLASIFKVSRKAVQQSLAGKTRSELANKIRTAAIRRGGMVQQFQNIKHL